MTKPTKCLEGKSHVWFMGTCTNCEMLRRDFKKMQKAHHNTKQRKEKV